MAMNKTVLATAIVDSLVPLNGELTGAARTQAITFWEKIADTIIAHIKNNAVVTINSATAANVTAGLATAAVTGTGTVTA